MCEMAAIQGVWPTWLLRRRRRRPSSALLLLQLWIIFMVMTAVTPEMVYRVDPLGNKISGYYYTYIKGGGTIYFLHAFRIIWHMLSLYDYDFCMHIRAAVICFGMMEFHFFFRDIR